MREVYEINELANRCGHFFNAVLSEENFIYNNGYNCRHPQQEEREFNERTGHMVVACFSWSCPLGYQADEEDFASKEIDLRGYTDYEENTFVVVEKEDSDDHRRDS